MAVVAGLVLAALTALAWWVSGRGLERPTPLRRDVRAPKGLDRYPTHPKTGAESRSSGRIRESAKIART
jgi:hypothetical protein